jgi:hypothetical protein
LRWIIGLGQQLNCFISESIAQTTHSSRTSDTFTCSWCTSCCSGHVVCWFAQTHGSHAICDCICRTIDAACKAFCRSYLSGWTQWTWICVWSIMPDWTTCAFQVCSVDIVLVSWAFYLQTTGCICVRQVVTCIANTCSSSYICNRIGRTIGTTTLTCFDCYLGGWTLRTRVRIRRAINTCRWSCSFIVLCWWTIWSGTTSWSRQWIRSCTQWTGQKVARTDSLYSKYICSRG